MQLMLQFYITLRALSSALSIEVRGWHEQAKLRPLESLGLKQGNYGGGVLWSVLTRK